MNIELELRMLSDWRVGTGTGIRGYADRLVQRGENGTAAAPAAPIIPAKTLIGVWRDSCEIAAHALDRGPSGVWHEWVEFLFGGQYASGSTPGRDGDASSPTRSRSVRPAALALDGALRLPGRLPALLAVRPRVAWAATFRKPGVAIDPNTGSAMPGKLRFEEMARAGVTLTGRACLRGFDELDQAQQDAALALLAAGARLLERIGGRRRRGSGRCRLTLHRVSPDFAVLARTPVPAPPAAATHHRVADRPEPAGHPAGQGWDRVELLMTAEQPVLAGAIVQGNLVQGQSSLPGWCLMPEVARRIGGAAHALIRTGDLIVTAATPRSPQGARTLPMPRVFRHAKDNRKSVIGNRLAGDRAEGKPYRDGHIAVEGEDVGTVVDPDFVVRMHNTVSDDVQRPNRDVGGVYIYRALAARTRLRAEVRVRSGVLEPGWEKRLSGRWRIGRSSKDDYGQLSVEVRPVTAAPRTRPHQTPGKLLRVWLLSDLLVRDRRLRPSTGLADAARALEQALARAGAPGVRLTPVPGSELSAHRTESWHRGWGLPRATLYGLAAGSCLVFEVDGGPIPGAVLDELRAAGVGERRAEGFGQIEIDHDLLLRSVAEWGSGPAQAAAVADASPVKSAESAGRAEPAAARPEEPEPLGPDEPGHAEARIFERAAWRSELRRRCELVAADPDRRVELLPADVTPSRLNGLREVVLEPTVEAARHRLAWLTEPREGRDPWPKENVTVIRGLIEDPDQVWALLGMPEEELTVTRDGAAVLRAELHDEAVRMLVTACVAAHARAEARRAVAGGIATGRAAVGQGGRTR